MSDRAQPPVRVVKVGGSLFDWPELPRALRAFLQQEPAAVNVLLAGGGDLAEAIRRADAALGIGEEAAHWLCIETLGITARMLAGVASLTLVQTLNELREVVRKQEPRTAVLDPREFLASDEPRLPGSVLPHSWNVTSDSIAARLAFVLSADELVLLKSAEAPAWRTLRDLSDAKYVDGHFPLAANSLEPRVRCVNLRKVLNG
jgi:aspartokinase-like uncharacterized kinase